MQRATIRDLKRHIGQEVEIDGWLYNKRSKGKIHFLQVRDGSGIVQAVMGKNDVDEDTFALAGRLAQEAAIKIRGTVHEDARSQGGVELHATGIELVAAPKREYPIQIADDVPSIDKLMNQRHLWLRSKKPHAVLKIRHEVSQAIRDFFYERGFVNVDTPILTPAACEGTTTLFEVPYFDLGTAYLTQSGQLYNEATAAAFGKVYCFGPVFRAEKSNTRKHLTEFWMVEPEMMYADLDDTMQLAEEFVSYILTRCLDRCATELATLERDTKELEAAAKLPYPRLDYQDACEKIIAKAAELRQSDDDELRRLGEQAMQTPGDDFGAPDETILGMLYDRPVMVHRYPMAVKAFYMKPDPQNPDVALCVDMIAPNGYGEIIGGGQREDDYDRLVAQIQKHELPMEAFEWFLDVRRYGSAPHAGFGLGLERTVGWIAGTKHIREAAPFPRMLYRIYP